MPESEDRFDEGKSVEEAKQFLLNALKSNCPAQDAANYANAYHTLVVAEQTRQKPEKNVDK